MIAQAWSRLWVHLAHRCIGPCIDRLSIYGLSGALLRCLLAKAHLLGKASTMSQVLLVIRGTSSLKEVLTDLAGHMVDFALGGHTHNGMLQVWQLQPT